MLEEEDLLSLNVLLSQLSLDSEYLYTQVLLRINTILNKYVSIKGVHIVDDIDPYDTFKINIATELKVALTLCNRMPSPPYLSSPTYDLKLFRSKATSRFTEVLILIKRADILYGVLK